MKYDFIANALSLEAFKEMDYKAVAELALPIELMMENAGLHLARVIARKASPKSIILIGAGNGNNGGGGLVAARRLAAWGYKVYLDLPLEITKELPLQQLKRALLYGAKREAIKNPDVWVDAYLGFSQKLPLGNLFETIIAKANSANTIRISLDLPMGISEGDSSPRFNADHIITLAAPKKLLIPLLETDTQIYIADLGIPEKYYGDIGVAMPPFAKEQLYFVS